MYNEYPEYPEITKIVLQKLRFAVSRAWSERELSHLPTQTIDYMIERESRTMVCRLEALVLGQEAEPVIIEYPDGWWEAVKQRWFPQRKVRLVRHEIQASKLFPRQSFDHQLGGSTYAVYHYSNKRIV